jgi:hypothetical protein
MKNFLFLAAVALVLSGEAPAQSTRTVTRNDMVWFAYFGKYQLNEKKSIYFDFGLRRKDWLNNWSQVLFRPGVTYALNERISFTAGVAYFSSYAPTYVRPEWRGWQQVLVSEKIGRVTINQRVRAEQRFNKKVMNNEVTDDFSYNNRFRYQLNVQLPLTRSSAKRQVYINLADEVMLNCGKIITSNYFDQNRASAGLGLKWNNAFNVTASYMKLFQQKAVNTYESDNVITVNIYHTLWSKKKDKS